MTSEPSAGESPYPANVERFKASRANRDGLRLQAWGGGDFHDMTFTRPQAIALAAEVTRIVEHRNRNYRGGEQ